ncbi:MAG: twin-arginine translocase TatA/TatE family subunit [Ghiorsea sp.]
MPDIGLVELALIGLIGFLVLGPERLPEFLGQVGKVVRQGRMWMASLKTQLDHEKQQLEKPVKEVTKSIESTLRDAENESQAESKNK